MTDARSVIANTRASSLSHPLRPESALPIEMCPPAVEKDAESLVDTGSAAAAGWLGAIGRSVLPGVSPRPDQLDPSAAAAFPTAIVAADHRHPASDIG